MSVKGTAISAFRKALEKQGLKPTYFKGFLFILLVLVRIENTPPRDTGTIPAPTHFY